MRIPTTELQDAGRCGRRGNPTMTSEFVRQIHQATCLRLLAEGCSEQQIREHLRNVWLPETEIQQLLAELARERLTTEPSATQLEVL